LKIAKLFGTDQYEFLSERPNSTGGRFVIDKSEQDNSIFKICGIQQDAQKYKNAVVSHES
jgi:hypothetical protein